MFIDKNQFFIVSLMLLMSSSIVLAAETKNYHKQQLKTAHHCNSKSKHPTKNTHYYTSISGGYGIFKDVLAKDSQTSILRLALGARFHIIPTTSLGVELGIQTAGRMRINSANAILAVGSGPIFLTIKPPIDALFTVAFILPRTPLAFHVKAGAVYYDGMIDSSTIPNKSQIIPEAQLGVSVALSKDVNLVASYQYLFGGSPILTNIDMNNGTAKLRNLPTMQAGFISIERSF